MPLAGDFDGDFPFDDDIGRQILANLTGCDVTDSLHKMTCRLLFGPIKVIPDFKYVNIAIEDER